MQLSWYNLLKSGYFHTFTKIWTLPCLLCTCAQWAWGAQDPNFFFQRWLYTTGSYAEKSFGIFYAHLRYLPISRFLDLTQLAIFKIKYNAFSKAKFGNFQKLLELNIYLQTIIIGEKNSL